MYKRSAPELPPPSLKLTTTGNLKIIIHRGGHRLNIVSIEADDDPPMLNHFSISNYQDSWTITTEANHADGRQKDISLTIIFAGKDDLRYSYQIRMSGYELQAYLISPLD